MNNWGRFIGNPNRKEVASMWSASPGFIPTQGCTSWLLWYLRFILLKRINRREWSGCECLYKWAKRHWHRKIKDPIRRQWSDPFHQRWDSARWFERGSRGSERERCSGCRSLSFPDFTSIPHMEPLWLPPFSLCPLLSVLSDSELEAVLSFLSSWRVTSVHLWDEKMTISLPVFHLTRFFFFFFRWEAQGRKETITCGVKGGLETLPCPVCRGRKRIGMRNWMGEKPEISGNGWEWPKKNFRHRRLVLSCRKVFPIMVSVCNKTAGRSLKACDSDEHVWKHENTESTFGKGHKKQVHFWLKIKRSYCNVDFPEFLFCLLNT